VPKTVTYGGNDRLVPHFNVSINFEVKLGNTIKVIRIPNFFELERGVDQKIEDFCNNLTDPESLAYYKLQEDVYVELGGDKNSNLQPPTKNAAKLAREAEQKARVVDYSSWNGWGTDSEGSIFGGGD